MGKQIDRNKGNTLTERESRLMQRDNDQPLNLTLEQTTQTEERLSRWHWLTPHMTAHSRAEARKSFSLHIM